ncbi:MAG: hypothetical protein ACQSGP_17720, partial [Frankia sp.]
MVPANLNERGQLRGVHGRLDGRLAVRESQALVVVRMDAHVPRIFAPNQLEVTDHVVRPDLAREPVISLGATVDDAAGEAFDKVARLLGLPFPGGPPIDRLAREGAATIPFPRGKAGDGTYDFSFSGLKTAVARWVEARRGAGEAVPVADVAASFQEAVADVL